MYRKSLLSIMSLLLTIGLVTGCDSGSTNGGGDSGKDDQFVADGDTVGTISISVNDSQLAVGETSSFSVQVKDANGGAVSDTRISCDTEVGLALVEPTTGSEMTDGFGGMSGVVGCEAPGSFRMGCRLPVGGNLRKFTTVKCSGTAPAGFTGFPGAGGGGLGGGVDTSGDDGDDSFGLRLVGITFSEVDAVSTTSLDTIQGICEDDTGEPFTDTTVHFVLQNNSNEIVRITNYTYTVANFDGNGNSHTSPTLTFIGEADSLDADGGRGTFSALFADATSVGPTNKRFFGRNESISDFGFKNITFNISGVTSGGKSVSISGRTAASFDNFNNCDD